MTPPNAAAKTAAERPSRQPDTVSPTVLADWRIPRTADDVHDARHYVRQVVTTSIGHSDVAYDVELLAGELLSNAVDHGGGEEAHVTVSRTAEVLRVQVHDEGSDEPDLDKTAGELDERGRGLLLIRALAAKWGIHHDQTGTDAWFEVTIP